jgi:microcystin-dependent protein
MTQTLAMTQLFDIAGAWPRDPGSAVATMAMVHSMAGNAPTYGAPDCDGRLLQIMDYQALAGLIGATFGGDGLRTIGLPDLRGRPATGGGTTQPPPGRSLSMTYMIAADAVAGGAAFPMPGAIGMFGANFVPSGWLAADGSGLPISQNMALFQAIGATYGGDGETFFRLPDLGQRAPVGAGNGVALGQDVAAGSDGVPGLGINYLINVAAPPAPESGNGGFPPETAMLGEVIAFAGESAPTGWQVCDGQLMDIAFNEALFTLLGTTYGGDGKSTFALPDLRGRMLTGPARFETAGFETDGFETVSVPVKPDEA